MGAIGFSIDFTRAESAGPNAAEEVHAIIVETVLEWMNDRLGTSGMRVRRDYLSAAIEYGQKHGTWGPTASRIDLFFSDFTRLETLGASVMHHWFLLAFSCTADRLRALARQRGIELALRTRATERLVTQRTDSPFIELGDEIYSLEDDEPVLVSSEGVERRTLASLTQAERVTVERAALVRQCECRACRNLRSIHWAGFDASGMLTRRVPIGGDANATQRAWDLLCELPTLRSDASRLGAILGAGDTYPDPLPPELFSLMDRLGANGARPETARLVAMCELLATTPPPKRPAIVLPTNVELPLRLVVVGDLRGEIDSTPLDGRPLLRIDQATFEEVRAKFGPPDKPEVNALWGEIRGLCATAQVCGRDDVLIDLLELSFTDLVDDFMAEGAIGSAFDELIVRRRLAQAGEIPVDVCLLTWQTAEDDQPWYEKIERILARGPVQAFGPIPSKQTAASKLLVHATDPFAAAREIIAGYVKSGYVESIDGFTAARVARHAAPVHLARTATTRAALESELAGWLSTNAGDGKPVLAATIGVDEPAAGSRQAPYTLAVVVRGRELAILHPTLFLVRALEPTATMMVPPPEQIAAGTTLAATALQQAFAELRAEAKWSLRTTLPLPDRWPLTRDARLWTYAFAYASAPTGPSVQIASRPIAAVVQRLGDTGPAPCIRLTESVESLGNQGVFPIGPGVIERLQSFPPAGVLLASALSGPLDEAKLEGLRARYEFYLQCHGLAFRAALANHPAFAEWLVNVNERP